MPKIAEIQKLKRNFQPLKYQKFNMKEIQSYFFRPKLADRNSQTPPPPFIAAKDRYEGRTCFGDGPLNRNFVIKNCGCFSTPKCGLFSLIHDFFATRLRGCFSTQGPYLYYVTQIQRKNDPHPPPVTQFQLNIQKLTIGSNITCRHPLPLALRYVI